MKIEVLKFYANWCGPCRVLSQKLEGKELTEINIEEDHETAIKYRVRNIPTLVFLKDGVEAYRTTGLITLNEFDMIMNEINDEKNIEVNDAEIIEPNTEK